ncbi:MAG: conjugal transfer protein TraF [Planctomycetes bacterium]|nr:conjugal transfer protein TraF [Planctomycetota bacterium]
MFKATLLLTLLAAVFSGAVQAEEWIDFSARDTALGGAGGIFGRGATGSYYNPANVTRRPWEKDTFPKFELDIPFGATASVHGLSYQRVFDAVKLAQELFDEFEDGTFQPGNPNVTTEDFGFAFKVFDSLDGLRSFNGDGIYSGAAAGIAVRVSNLFLKRDGISVRLGAFGLAAATSLVDMDSLRGYRLTNAAGAQFDSIIQQAMTNSGGNTAPSSAGGQQFSQQLQAAGYPQAIADGLADIAEDSGINFGGAASSVLFDFLVNSRNGTGTSLESGANPLEGNRTGFLLRGAVFYEAAVTYGFGLPVLGLDDWLAFGVTPKLIQCYTFSQALYVEDFQNDEGPQKAIDSLTEQLQDAMTFNGENAQIGFGIDLGIVFTPQLPVLSGLCFALSGRNLNSPEFTFDDKLPGAPKKVRLDAQFRGGVSYTLFAPNFPLTFGVEADLNPVSSDLLPNYHTQFVRFGASFEPNFGLFGLGVRLGALKNVADAEQPITMAAGLGFRIVVVKLDFGAQFSFDQTLFGGENTDSEDEGFSLPQRVALYAQLGIAINF